MVELSRFENELKRSVRCVAHPEFNSSVGLTRNHLDLNRECSFGTLEHCNCSTCTPFRVHPTSNISSSDSLPVNSSAIDSSSESSESSSTGYFQIWERNVEDYFNETIGLLRKHFSTSGVNFRERSGSFKMLLIWMSLMSLMFSIY